MKRVILLLFILVTMFLIPSFITSNNGHNCTCEKIIVVDTVYVKSFLDKSPKEGLLEALEYMGIEDKERVYCQAVLETGNFTSGGCTRDNNLFGLFNSREMEFYTYDHWFQSVIDYKYKIAYKKCDGENHYDFLCRIGYAEDPDYVSKLKIIEKRIFSSQETYFAYTEHTFYQGLI